MVQPLSPALVQQLCQVVGEAHVLTQDDLTAGYVTDWTGRFVGATPAVVRPADTAQVAAVLSLCQAHGVRVVPQGGNTGLVGGSVPLAGELVLSLRRLDALGPVDSLMGQVTVGAGVTLAALQQHAAASGRTVGVDLGARQSATIGGMVATNAGGIHVVRHGTMRAQVVGIEAVLADGTVLSHLGGLLKDNTGYDLASLLCGSEGTLGVITAVRLSLPAAADRPVVAAIGHHHLGVLVHVVGALRDDARLRAAELVLADGVALVERVLGITAASPFHAPACLLVELDGGAQADASLAALERLVPDDADVAVAVDDPAAADRLWRIRESHTEAINTLGPPVKLDVTLPLTAITAFVEALPHALGALAGEAIVFGHLGDGNLHVNIPGAGADEGRAHGIEDAVLRLTVRHGGTISAEHGIGTAKREWLHLVRSAGEIEAFRRIKAALDPTGVLHPHCLLPEPSAPGVAR